MLRKKRIGSDHITSPTPDLYIALDDDGVPPPAKQLTGEVKFNRKDGASSGTRLKAPERTLAVSLTFSRFRLPRSPKDMSVCDHPTMNLTRPSADGMIQKAKAGTPAPHFVSLSFHPLPAYQRL